MVQRSQILYQKVFNQLKSDLISGKYEVGTLFPTENDLMAAFGVSKITVRKAVELLVEGGYLHKQSGVGTKVISNQPINVFNKAKTFTKILNDHGVDVRNTIVYVGKSKDTAINTRFTAKEIYEIHRIYYLDDVASIFVKHYFPLIDATFLPQNAVEHFSFYSFLEKQGIKIFDIQDAFSAKKTPEWLIKAMSGVSDITLERIRSAFDEQGELVEYTISSYDSEKTPYFIDYQV